MSCQGELSSIVDRYYLVKLNYLIKNFLNFSLLRTNKRTYLFCKVSSLPKLRGYPNIYIISCSSNLSGYPNPDIYNSGEYLNISNTEEYPNISNSGVRHVTRRGCWVHICPCLPLALCTALRKPVYRSTLSHILLYYIFL